MGDISHRDNRVYISGVEPSTKAAMEFGTKMGKQVRIILLSQQQASNSWKIPINGQNYLFITPADIFADKDAVYLRSRDPNAFSVSILPSVDEKIVSTHSFQKTGRDGVFSCYTASVQAKEIPLVIKLIHRPSLSYPVKMGAAFDWRQCSVAAVPDESAFDEAGIWRLELPRDMLSGLSDIYLDIDYAGDIGRFYDGTHLLGDNFFNGTAWEIGLKRFVPDLDSNGFDLKILPLRKDAPVYIPKSSWPDFKGVSQIAEVNAMTASPEYEVKLTFTKK